MEPQRPVRESAPPTCFQSQAFFSFIIIINIITFPFTVVLQVRISHDRRENQISIENN